MAKKKGSMSSKKSGAPVEAAAVEQKAETAKKNTAKAVKEETGAAALNGGVDAATAAYLAGYLVKTPWWLVLIALGTLAADVLFQWVLLRRREVKL